MEKASECIEAIRMGDIEALNRLLRESPALVEGRVSGEGGDRTLLHVTTDWPGHFPNVRASVEALIAYGADVNASFNGRHSERPLQCACSALLRRSILRRREKSHLSRRRSGTLDPIQEVDAAENRKRWPRHTLTHFSLIQ